MIAGVAWDFGGPWPSYALGFAWGVALTLALLRAPEAAISAGDHRDPRRRARLRVVDVLPRLPDYVRCFALMAIPAVATTMAIHFLRTATNGVQSSLYVVYLKGIGLTGTSIGVLFAAIEITSGLGSLFAGRMMRLGDPQRTMLSGTVLSILLICGTPFFRRHFRPALYRAGVTRLAARGRPADDVLGAGESRRSPPSGFGCRAAADHEPTGGDRDPAGSGRHRRPLGCGPRLCHPRHRFDPPVRAGHLDHPAGGADPGKSGSADVERLTHNLSFGWRPRLDITNARAGMCVIRNNAVMI
jgi:hypothetical protein